MQERLPDVGRVHGLPEFGRIALSAARIPAADPALAGGGWCDVVALDDDRAALVVGDVGSESGAGQLRQALTACLRAGLPPAAALEKLDRAAADVADTDDGVVACLVLDAGAGLLQWVAAGPVAPLLTGPDGARHLTGGGGAPLGRAGRSRFVQAEEAIGAGCTVVLVNDAPRAHPGDADQLAVTAARGQHLAPDELMAALNGDVPPRDGDVVVVLARLMPAPLAERLPADARRLQALRRTLGAWSAQAALPDDTTADLQLLVSEAATNAVEHAYRDAPAGELVYSVRRRTDGAVRVEVQDFGRWRPPPEDPGYRGRGLAVIHNLAEEVTLDVTDGGTRIAFTVPSSPPSLDTRPLLQNTQQWWRQRQAGGADAADGPGR